MRRETISLPIPGSPGAGTARTVEALENLQFEVEGSGTWTLAIEARMTSGGTFKEIATVSAACLVAPDPPLLGAYEVRVNLLSLSSGAPTAVSCAGTVR